MKCLLKKIFLPLCFYNIQIVLSQDINPSILTLHVKKDTSLSFALYTPAGTVENIKTKPALFFFEPWGNGSYPVSQYAQLAKKYDFILIGFNGSRNGLEFEESIRKFDITLDELKNEYGLDPRTLCLVGFSGGGKVAIKTAAVQPAIRYLIYGGATIDEYLAGKEILGFAGTKDMNYTDLLDFNASLNIKTNIRHFIIEYEGSHTWFDTTTMENSFIWLKLNLIREKILTPDTGFLNLLKKKYQQPFFFI